MASLGDRTLARLAGGSKAAAAIRNGNVALSGIKLAQAVADLTTPLVVTHAATTTVDFTGAAICDAPLKAFTGYRLGGAVVRRLQR